MLVLVVPDHLHRPAPRRDAAGAYQLRSRHARGFRDMAKLFISHSSHDDGFVRDLREALADHGQPGWIDSRELRGGEPL